MIDNIIDVYEVSNADDLDPDNTELFVATSFTSANVTVRLDDAFYVVRITSLTPPAGHEITRLDPYANKTLINNLITALYGMLPPEEDPA